MNGQLNWIVVVLQPYGAYQLWGAAANEWRNAFIPAHEALGHSLDKIVSQLLQAPALHNALALLDAWLIDLAGHNETPDYLLLKAIQLINAGEGRQPIHLLLQQLQVHERTLERKFRQATGISPKQYSGIVRLTASARKIRHLSSSGHLTGIAYDNDYFDQAHFIKDFRKFTGITPWQYQHSASPLALNLLRR